MKKVIRERKEQSEGFLAGLDAQIVQTEERLQQLKDAKQQIKGRIAVLEELLSEPDPVTDKSVDSVE